MGYSVAGDRAENMIGKESSGAVSYTAPEQALKPLGKRNINT